MKTTTRAIAVGIFDNRPEARRALQSLRKVGFRDDDLGVIAPGDKEIRTAEEASLDDEEDSKAGSGALTGAAAGLGVGGLWGLGVVAGMLPAVGPVIAGGALAAVLASAAAGAAAGGIIGALVGMGIPEDEAEYYQKEVERGNILVTVQAGDRYEEAQEVLYDFGARNVNRRDASEPSDTGRPGLAGPSGEGAFEAREERPRAPR